VVKHKIALIINDNMKRIILFGILLLFALNSFSQEFYFPKEYYIDSIAIAKHLPILANQLIASYKETDRQTYFDDLSYFQMVGEQYAEENKSLDSLREFYKSGYSESNSVKGLFFPEQAFASAKLIESEKHIPFANAYSIVFRRLYNSLPERTDIDVEASIRYYGENLGTFQIHFFELLNSQKGKDSIYAADARKLCIAYMQYNVYNQVVKLSDPLIAEHEVKRFIIEDSVLIKTRDGATISAVIVRNRNIGGKQPTILKFNIYNSSSDKEMAKISAINGYVGIVASTRGKGLSPEEIEPFEHDANDGYDIIDWICKQPWSNCKVGMYGGSYLGFSQWAAVKKVHPALKTIVPLVAVGIGEDFPMVNNIFASNMLRWLHYVTNSKETDDNDYHNTKHWDSVFTKWYASGKSFRSLDTLEGRPNAIFQRWLTHPGYDSFWQKMIPYQTDFANINIPVLTITGYFDEDQLGAMYYFKQHYLYNKNAKHYLVIGPFDHNGPQHTLPASVFRGYKIDSIARINFPDLIFQWFNYILKDSIKPVILKDKINYEVMGANEWKHVPVLGKMNNDTISFYLSNRPNSQFYQLSEQPANNLEFINQEVDFKDRNDSADDRSWNLIDSSFDNSNGLSFISAPFDKSFEINGSFIGEIKASINKKDMDLAISMYELMPNGKYFQLLLGRLSQTRASYSKNRSLRQLLQPGQIETIPIINTYFTSKKISAGSKLVIVLSIQKTSEWQINYGTGKDVSDETIADAMIPLQIKWYNNSVIKIPVHRD
jgi:uncharacterized protein